MYLTSALRCRNYTYCSHCLTSAQDSLEGSNENGGGVTEIWVAPWSDQGLTLHARDGDAEALRMIAPDFTMQKLSCWDRDIEEGFIGTRRFWSHCHAMQLIPALAVVVCRYADQHNGVIMNNQCSAMAERSSSGGYNQPLAKFWCCKKWPFDCFFECIGATMEVIMNVTNRN